MGVNKSPNSRVLLTREGIEAKEGVQSVTRGNTANLSESRVSKFLTLEREKNVPYFLNIS